MQLLPCVVSLLAASALAASASPTSSASAAWRPHEFDDVQDLVAQEAASLRDVQGGKPTKLVLSARRKPVVHLARHTSKIERELANPALGGYLGVKRPAGKEFSTQWSTKPWNEVAGHDMPQSLAWHPADDLVDRQPKAAPRAPAVPYSRLLSDDMKDAVVVAESLKADAEAPHSPARALHAATAWGPAPKQGLEKNAVLAESRAAVREAAENPYTTMLGVSQGLAAKVANPYEAYLASDKDQFKAYVHREEARAEHVEEATKTNGYEDDVVPDTVSLTLTGR